MMSTPNIYRQAISNNVTLLPYPFPSELGMEAYLMDNPSILKLDDGKYASPQIIECEVSIKCNDRRPRGRIDLVVRYDKNLFGILELKKYALNREAMFQLFDYLDAREQIVEALNGNDAITDLNPSEVQFVGILVGGYVDEALRPSMPVTNIEQNRFYEEYKNTVVDKPVALHKYTTQISAITLERFLHPQTSDIVVISTPIVRAGVRDTTKYVINGEYERVYGKAKLVHEIVKRYAARNGAVPVEKLNKIFPTPKAIRSFGVFAELERAKANPTRYYADMPIDIGGGKCIATCNQWSKESIDEFVASVNAKNIGFVITPL